MVQVRGAGRRRRRAIAPGGQDEEEITEVDVVVAVEVTDDGGHGEFEVVDEAAARRGDVADERDRLEPRADDPGSGDSPRLDRRRAAVDL